MRPFQHHTKALNMILNKPKYYPIIEVDFKKFVYKIFKGSYYNSGKNCRGILKSKWHYRILKPSPLCHKVILVSVFICNPDLMVTKKSIHD